MPQLLSRRCVSRGNTGRLLWSQNVFFSVRLSLLSTSSRGPIRTNLHSTSPSSSSSDTSCPPYLSNTLSASLFDWIPPGRGRKVAVAMSGGIDSAVAAFIMQQRGYSVTGVFMKNWDVAEEGNYVQTNAFGVRDKRQCSYSVDRRDVHAIGARLRIPIVEVNFTKDYWNSVFMPFLDDYQSGQRTPNPDVLCNRYIKFECLLHYVKQSLQIEAFAFGHYAMLNTNGSVPRLFSATDLNKDQSYFLSMTRGVHFRNVFFPVGNILKTQVRLIASEVFEGLDVLSKKESMGICFIGRRLFPDFLGEYFPLTRGNYIDWDTGQVVGQHRGKEALTIGQGARIGGAPSKYYILERCKYSGDVYVVRSQDHPDLLSTEAVLSMDDFSWIAGSPPDELKNINEDFRFSLLCRCRHRQPLRKCEIELFKDETNDRFLKIYFSDEPERAITPGQILALYRDNECLGGGIILSRA